MKCVGLGFPCSINPLGKEDVFEPLFSRGTELKIINYQYRGERGA